jgi:hypothetical protein
VAQVFRAPIPVSTSGPFTRVSNFNVISGGLGAFPAIRCGACRTQGPPTWALVTRMAPVKFSISVAQHHHGISGYAVPADGSEFVECSGGESDGDAESIG